LISFSTLGINRLESLLEIINEIIISDNLSIITLQQQSRFRQTWQRLKFVTNMVGGNVGVQARVYKIKG